MVRMGLIRVKMHLDLFKRWDIDQHKILLSYCGCHKFLRNNHKVGVEGKTFNGVKKKKKKTT